MKLDLAAHGRGAYVVVTVRGEIDVATAPQLRDFLCDIVHTRGAQVIADVRGRFHGLLRARGADRHPHRTQVGESVMPAAQGENL